MSRLYTAKLRREEDVDDYCQRIEWMSAQARTPEPGVYTADQKHAVTNGLALELKHAQAALTSIHDIKGASFQDNCSN